MGRTELTDPARVVHAARELFWDRGYEAVSIAELEAVTGLTTCDLERHFGSKRGLYGAAIADYFEVIVAPQLSAMRAADDARQGILDYFEALAAFVSQQGTASVTTPGVASRGCMLLDSAVGIAAHDPEQRRVVAGYLAELSGAFGASLQRATPDAAAEVIARTARLLLAVAVSAMVLARVDPCEAVAILGTADDLIW